ncbi:Aldehyde dehydrogenase domain protein, partial [mine drainage metagenome]
MLVADGFADVDGAVAAANASPYGLLAAVWTRDLGTAHAVARRLESGMVVVNEAPTTFPQTPFGGFKASGIGFEQSP